MTFVRYVTIQLLAYAIDMGAFLLLIYPGVLGPVAANAVGKVAAGVFAFLAHRSFTFQLDKDKHHGKQKYRYFALLGFNVPLSALVLGLVLLVVSNPVVAKILSDVISVYFTYWLSKKWVFAHDARGEISPSREKTMP